MPVIYGGKPIYGAPIGIVMLDCLFPRPLGDIGNAASFSFPVLYEIVEDTFSEDLTMSSVPFSVNKMINAAKRLEKRGVKAIVTSCGLLLPYQKVLNENLSIPVASSTILLLPLIKAILGSEKKIAILVSSYTDFLKKALEDMFKDYMDSIVITSMEGKPEFMRGIMSQKPPYQFDMTIISSEALDVCQESLRRNKNIGAILIECTNLSPYSPMIREKLQVPVFDVLNLVNILYQAV